MTYRCTNRRREVFQRDRGVCAICAFDCHSAYSLSCEDLVARGFRASDHASGLSLWQVDHITPTVLGGATVLDNLRTLCCPCHRRVTAKLAADRARARQAEADRRWREERARARQAREEARPPEIPSQVAAELRSMLQGLT